MLGIVSGSEVQSRQIGQKISGSAFRNEALAAGDRGAAIGNAVANVSQGLADQIAQARNTKKIFDADLTLTKTKDQFVASLSTNPELASDPGKWLPAFDQQAQQATDAIMGQNDLSPAAKKHLAMMTQNWTEQSRTDIQFSALKRETKDTRDSGLATASTALADGNVDKAVVAYKALNEAGVIGPKMRDALIAKAPATAAEGSANQTIARFPTTAPDVLPKLKGWDKIKPQDQRVLLHQAYEARASAQTSNLNEFSAQMDDSPDHRIPDGLKQAMDTNQISAKGYEGIINRQKRLVADDQKAAAAEDRVDGSKIALDMTDENWVGLKNPKEVQKDYTDRINGITDVALRERLTRQMNNKMDAAAKKAKTPDSAAHERLSGLLKNGYFGDTDNAETSGPAYEQYGKMLDTFEGWKKEHPDATTEEQMKEISQMTAPQVEAKVKGHFWDSVLGSYQLPPMMDFGSPRPKEGARQATPDSPDIDDLLKKYGGK